MLIPRAQQIKGRGARRPPTMKPAERTHKLNLTKHDIRGPLRVAGAQASSANVVAQVAEATARTMEEGFKDFTEILEAFTTAKDQISAAEAAANYQRETAKLRAELVGQNSLPADHPYITDAMRERHATTTIDEDGAEVRTPATSIPTHDVMNEIYDDRAWALEQDALAGLKTDDGREDFFKAVRTTRANGAAEIVTSKYKKQREELKAQANGAAQVAINLPDPLEAEVALNNVAEKALASRAWTPAEHNKILTEGLSAIDYKSYDMRIRTARTQDKLHEIERSILEDDHRVVGPKRHELLEEVQGRMESLDSELIRDRKERKELNSGAVKKRVLLKMTTSRLPLGDAALTEAVKQMTDTDAGTVLTVQRSLQKEAKAGVFRTPPAFLLSLRVKINELLLPSDVPMSERRAEMRRELMRAAGYDPQTKTLTGPQKISAADFSSLDAKISTVEALPYNNAQIDRVTGLIYGLLTRGSKGSFNWSTASEDSHHKYQLAIEAEEDMLTEALRTGQGFDPNGWWAENKRNYLTGAMLKSHTSLGKGLGEGIIVYDGARQAVNMNLEKTLKAARAQYPNWKTDPLAARRIKQIMGYASQAKNLAVETLEANK